MKLGILVTMILAMVVAVTVTAIGIDHSAMGEFCVDDISTTCELDLTYTAGIFITWFCAALIPLLAICYGMVWLWRTRNGPPV